MHQIAQLTSGYSGSDLAALARDAAYGPIRWLCFFPPLTPSNIFLLQRYFSFKYISPYNVFLLQIYFSFRDISPSNIFLLQRYFSFSLNMYFSFRELKIDEVKSLDPVNLRKINMSDFLEAMKRIKKWEDVIKITKITKRCLFLRSVSADSLVPYEAWNQKFGEGAT